ncbi:SLAM family member 6-like isoform X2 [Struthio camelus]|uniref:SLAM family member 6-like isoform X2 n=2 Tax=Struthio camelus TaxID=8801 RepID=UPI0036041A31
MQNSPSPEPERTPPSAWRGGEGASRAPGKSVCKARAAFSPPFAASQKLFSHSREGTAIPPGWLPLRRVPAAPRMPGEAKHSPRQLGTQAAKHHVGRASTAGAVCSAPTSIRPPLFIYCQAPGAKRKTRAEGDWLGAPRQPGCSIRPAAPSCCGAWRARWGRESHARRCWGPATSPLYSPLPLPVQQGVRLGVGEFACSLPPPPKPPPPRQPQPAQLRPSAPRAATGTDGGMETRRSLAPRLLALLGLAAGAVSAQPGAGPIRVNGLLGGSVLLSPALPPNARVKEIEWSFSAGAGRTIQVAEFKQGKLARPDPGDRFKQRLEMFDETLLRIGALELGDSGVYGARIKLHPALVEDQSFNLSVYEPVAAPEIQSEVVARTPHECNVSLRCRAPAGRDVLAVWLPGGSSAEDGAARLDVRVDAGGLDANYTCEARNPVHRRSSSVHLRSLCRDDGAVDAHRMWHACLAPLLLVAPATTLAAFWLWKKRRKKAAAGALAASSEEEDAPLEPQYAQIQCREGRPKPPSPVITIYEQVRVAAGSPAEPLA